MIARGGPPRREALINLAREPSPTRETGWERARLEEVVEETAVRRGRAGGRGWGGREGGREAEDGGDGGGALSPAIAGKTGDRKRRRLSRKFGNYRCRVVFFSFLSFSPLFFSTSDIDLGEAVRIRGTSIPCDSAEAMPPPARCITAQRALRGTRRALAGSARGSRGEGGRRRDGRGGGQVEERAMAREKE